MKHRAPAGLVALWRLVRGPVIFASIVLHVFWIVGPFVSPPTTTLGIITMWYGRVVLAVLTLAGVALTCYMVVGVFYLEWREARDRVLRERAHQEGRS